MDAPLDLFAQLGQPRRPWLEPEELKEAFHQRAAVTHPDSGGAEGGAFTDANAAYHVLRDPARRLKHLIELEFPEAAAETQQISNAIAQRFLEVATLCREADTFLSQQPDTPSALGQALVAQETFSLRRDLDKELLLLEQDEAAGLEALRAEDALWTERDTATAARLRELQQRFAFLGKWSDQLRERLARLAGSAT